MATSGMPKVVDLGICRKASGSEADTTCLPLNSRMSIPRMMYSVASVTTRLGTRPAATMNPLTTPHARPMPSPARKTTGMGMPGCGPNRFEDAYADRPSTDPTDRSTFLLITTIVSPRASRAITVVSTSTNWMFVALRNRGWTAAVIATKTARTTTMPDSLIRKTRSARAALPVRLPGSSGRCWRRGLRTALTSPPAGPWPRT